MTTHVNIPALVSSVSPTVQIENGQAITTSVEVARVFEKRHDDVLKSIRTLVADLPDDRLRNFAETVETRPNPSGGAPIKSPAYHLTRDGFTLLAFGFTGKKAMAFKLAYIDAFNRMEAALMERARIEQEQAALAAATITGYEQYQLNQRVCDKCIGWGQWQDQARREVYQRLCEKYAIPHYTELARVHFKAALVWIDRVKLNQPRPNDNVAGGVTASQLDDYTYALSHLQHEILRHIGTKLLTRPDDCQTARWLVSFASDDRGKPIVPRVTALDASATMVQVISAGAVA